MRGNSAFKARTVAGALAALVAVAGFTTSALAGSFTSTLSTDASTTDVESPDPCSLGVQCTLTVSGNQSSSPGGSGTYVSTSKFVPGAISTVNGQNCFALTAGSSLRLTFSTGAITMTTAGSYCGNLLSDGSGFSFSGPFTITSNTTAYDTVNGSGTLSGTYTFADRKLRFRSVNGTTSGGGGGGLGGGGGINPGVTPELSSILLFGSGALGVASYGLARLRGRKR